MKTRLRLLVAANTLLLIALLPSLATAFECAAGEQGPPSYQTLTALTVNLCLGEERDTGQITKTVIEEARLIAEEEASQVATLKRSIEGLVSLAAEGLLDGPQENDLVGSMKIQLERLLREIEAAGDLGTGLLKPEPWQFDVENPNLPQPAGFDVRAFLDAACPPGVAPDANCRAAFVTSKEAVRFATLIARLLGSATNLGELLESMQRRGRQWDAYFNQARSQYLWELLLNDRLTLVDDRPPNAKGQPAGFRSVPNRQFVLLHPSVALEYVDDAADGEQFQEAVMAEIVGFNKWRWKDDGSIGRAFGASLIVSASDRGSTDDLGWGLMLHVNNKYSLAVTDHDGDTGFLVTADVAKLWTRVSEARKSQMMRGEE